METFEYDLRSVDLVYLGQQLDSLLELKFILMIENTHAWIRQGLDIYYNINNVEAGIKGGLEKHTPDFLIREWTTGNATLVEIKPDRYDNITELHRRRKICRNFIKQFGYDWDYKIIRGHNITLNASQHKKLEIIRRFHVKSIPHWHEPHHQNNTSFSDSQYETFVRQGLLPAPAL
jgi:hypothetical protein